MSGKTELPEDEILNILEEETVRMVEESWCEHGELPPDPPRRGAASNTRRFRLPSISTSLDGFPCPSLDCAGNLRAANGGFVCDACDHAVASADDYNSRMGGPEEPYVVVKSNTG